MERVGELLSLHRTQNPYLYIDTKTFGFGSDNIDTWVIEQGGDTVGVIYRYYNSLQLCVFDADMDVSEIAEFMRSGEYSMASGTADVVRKVASILDNYSAHTGVIMEAELEDTSLSGATELASVSDCHKIAELICSDDDIGGHYSVPLLEKQLAERMTDWNCINVILKSDGKIVCHMATYADCDELCVLGGLITESEHRGHGYGRIVLTDLAKHVAADGKIPLLYCYDENTIAWYKRLGWKLVTECGKLERKKS